MHACDYQHAQGWLMRAHHASALDLLTSKLCVWHLLTEINALLTDCKVELGPDGSPTPETQLQHWPRHAPPPKCLRLTFPSAAPPPGSSHGLLTFLKGCMGQRQATRVLEGVQELWLLQVCCWAFMLDNSCGLACL